MLNCREVSERASDFLDAALPWHARLHVQLHLLMCQICREYVRQLRLVIAALRRLPPDRPPKDLTSDLVARFKKEAAGS